MDEQNQSENIYRFKWFMSLSRKRSPRIQESPAPNKSCTSASSEKLTNSSSSGVFFTLRKRFQKKLTSIKIKAYEPEQLISSGTSNHLQSPESNRLAASSAADASSNPSRSVNDFARIVIERHSQNPIRFSSPNLPVISSSGDVPPPTVEPPQQNETGDAEQQSSTTDPPVNLDAMMEKVRADLLKYGWYWGKLTRSAAQKRLTGQDNGTFLVRDSETEKDQFAVSFRSSGITLHCRIDYKDNYWTFSGLTTPTQYGTMIELIEDSMRKSEFDVIGFGRQTSPLTPPFPVRLKKPINRFYEVSSLQHMCRFIIRQRINTNDITSLPLPSKLKDYIEENFYDF